MSRFTSPYWRAHAPRPVCSPAQEGSCVNTKARELQSKISYLVKLYSEVLIFGEQNGSRLECSGMHAAAYELFRIWLYVFMLCCPIPSLDAAHSIKNLFTLPFTRFYGCRGDAVAVEMVILTKPLHQVLNLRHASAVLNSDPVCGMNSMCELFHGSNECLLFFSQHLLYAPVNHQKDNQYLG